MELQQKVLIEIERSSSIEFTWAKNPNDLARHTMLVLRFDNISRLTLDFSDHVNSKSSTGVIHASLAITQAFWKKGAKKIKARVDLNLFDLDSRYEFLGTLLKFAITDRNAKDKAKRLIKRALQIEMGDYHLKTNNCRHYIQKVFEMLNEEPECSEENKSNFERQMTLIEREDKQKIEEFQSTIGKTLKGLGLVFSIIAVFGAQWYIWRF